MDKFLDDKLCDCGYPYTTVGGLCLGLAVPSARIHVRYPFSTARVPQDDNRTDILELRAEAAPSEIISASRYQIRPVVERGRAHLMRFIEDVRRIEQLPVLQGDPARPVHLPVKLCPGKGHVE